MDAREHKTVKAWSKSRELLQTLTGHSSGVENVVVDGDVICRDIFEMVS